MAKGGAREGAGRPKNPEGERKQRQVRAYDEEFELIKAFVKIVREDTQRAKRILETE